MSLFGKLVCSLTTNIPLQEATTIVVITRNRVERGYRTLEKLIRLPQKPSIIVVDNVSTDGTPERVRIALSMVLVLEQKR